MATNDLKPKGGRGKRADYRTVQVRCPEPIKQAVTELINQWHEQPEQLNKNLNTGISDLALELKQEKAINQSLRERLEKMEKMKDERLSDLAVELGNTERELERLKQLNQNLNTAIDEFRKQNQELDTENLKLHEQTGDLALEVDNLKAELGNSKINLNTSINPDIVPILENALTLKANAGGKIKDAIREALKLLE